MQYNVSTLQNAWLRHVTWAEMFLHSRPIKVVPGLQLISLLIDLEIVWCYSNLWIGDGGAQDRFITDTMTNTVGRNRQQCSNLCHGLVEQIRYRLDSDRVWHRAGADQISIGAEYNTSVRMMRDARTDLLDQMIDYGLQQSRVCVTSHMPGLDIIWVLIFRMVWKQIGVNLINLRVSLDQGDSAPFELGVGWCCLWNMQYKIPMLILLKTLLNAWLRHVSWVDMTLYSRLIRVVPGLELLLTGVHLKIG